MSRPPSLLIISHDIVGAQMAGPGIRAVQLARAVAPHLPVTLAVPAATPPDLGAVPFDVAAYDLERWETLAPLVEEHATCLAAGDLVGRFPALGNGPAALVVDGYDPVLAEWLAVCRHLPLETQHPLWQARLAYHPAQFHLGDFFICAGERQRDWWLGQLEAHGRINPATYAEDPTLRRLVDVVPYAMPDTPLHAAHAARDPLIKGVWPGIAATDRLILWGGGLWPWLDPLTAIRAMTQVASRQPAAKLVFPGTRHPNPAMAEMPSHHAAALALAEQEGLLDRHVFFGDWVPYADWPAVLAESDVAISLHLDTIETRLAFRSRILEYLWAGLPVVATGGDATGDLVAAYAVGEIVNVQDVAGVAAALLRLLDEAPAARAEGFGRARRELTWSHAAAPLIAFCQAPRRAPDRAGWLPQPVNLEPALTQAQANAAYWRDLAERYAQGRIMRALRSLDRLARRAGVKS
ncbi:MAG: glycosyltransferase family 4 protein [Caldilineaceae bacterium]|nr:glycosyltransferase family 4 protein [Caldilineaceae bacterium]